MTTSSKFLEGMLGEKQIFIKIGNKKIGINQPPYIICEIGINHNGCLDTAVELIRIASRAGANAVKFQKRDLNSIYQEKVLLNPNDSEEGFKYLIPLLREVEFEKKQFDILYKETLRHKMDFLCTPFDENSLKFLDFYKVPAYKIASGDMVNLCLLEQIIAKKKPLIISTGMSSLQEIDFVGQYLKNWGAECALLHCVSAYPTPVDDAHLNFIKTLQDRYGIPIGISSHEMGIEVTLAAVAMGACIVERHITLDKRQKGPDHAASLEPKELEQMIAHINLVTKAKGLKTKKVSRIVTRTAELLGKSLVANCEIAAGIPITRQMVTVKGPGKGLSPLYLDDLLGKRTARKIKKDDFFLLSDCNIEEEKTESPRFASQWGLKGRFYDLDGYCKFNPKFVEVHMNDQDVDYAFFEKHKGKKYPFQIMLHYPTYWHRSVLDLAHPNLKKRLEFVRVIQKIINLARNIKNSFVGSPSIIIHLGGMDIKPVQNNTHLINLANDSLSRLDWNGVNLLIENNPPRPWYFSGQWYDNAFCSVEEVIDICKKFNCKMCLDTSHAKLYTNLTKADYSDYIKKAAPFATHLHIADAYGVDGEGIQIGEGEIDFNKVFSILNKNGDLKKMTWTAEIWQGHLNDCAGFFKGFQRLRKVKELKPIK